MDGADDLELVAALDVDDQLQDLVEAEAQAVVDFTHPDAVMDNLEFCIGHGIHAVVGTTGFDEARLATVEGWLGGPRGRCADRPQLLDRRGADDAVRRGPRRSTSRSRWSSCTTPDKADAPSGTARRTAELIAAARREAGTAAGARRDDDRPGRRPRRDRGRDPRARVADPRPGRPPGGRSRRGGGDAARIRHDSLDRASFTPGVLTALRAIADRPGLTVGLEHLLGLD